MLTLFYHPLSSYCWKALIALYENGTPFEPRLINLGDESSAATLRALWPVTKFPVLEDADRRRIIPEATIIIEYVADHYPGNLSAIPADPDEAIEARLMDRLFDNYVMTPMQKIVTDRLRPADARDSHGVAEARALLACSYALLEARLAGRTWAAGDVFGLADCAAMPSLHYADRVAPFRAGYPVLGAYLARLEARPSAQRVLEEAAPYMQYFPSE
jgi:glutathione S-transferase